MIWCMILLAVAVIICVASGISSSYYAREAVRHAERSERAARRAEYAAERAEQNAEYAESTLADYQRDVRS
jgi:cell division protein FtsL